MNYNQFKVLLEEMHQDAKSVPYDIDKISAETRMEFAKLHSQIVKVNEMTEVDIAEAFKKND